MGQKDFTVRHSRGQAAVTNVLVLLAEHLEKAAYLTLHLCFGSGKVQVKLLLPPDHLKEHFVIQIPYS